MKRWKCALAVLGLFSFLAVNQVDTDLTAEDREVIQYMVEYHLPELRPPKEFKNFRAETMYIFDLVRAVLAMTELGGGIPRGAPREPMDVYLRQMGECYDRSRFIEKMLRYAGFKARHAVGGEAIGAFGVVVAAEPLIGARERQRRLRRFAFAPELA